MEFSPNAAAFVVARDAEWKAEGLLTRAERKALLAAKLLHYDEKGKGKGQDKVSATVTEAWLNETTKGKGK